MAGKKGELGTDLGALLGENALDNENMVVLPIHEVEPNRDQPRKTFDEEALAQLSESIAKHGLLQPILVKPLLNGRYSIIAGERRWRACRMAGLSEIPAVIRETDEQTLSEIALIENLQREDLNAVEEALGYRGLIDRFGLTQEAVAESVGKSRAAVTNALRLLNLGDAELRALESGEITAGHARALLACEDAALRERLLQAAKAGASVRELERAAAAKKRTARPKTRDRFYDEVALSLKTALHRKVKIQPSGKEKGTITLEFYSREELAEFARKLASETK